MAAGNPEKIPLRFYRTKSGNEPVREWLLGMEVSERHQVGQDLMRVQWQWPVGMPLCRPMGQGLWEVRTNLSTRKIARVLFCLHDGVLVALHGFIKTTQATPDEELALARKRQKELGK